MTVFDKYGYCILPAGATIFHGNRAQQGNDAIFYCMQPCDAFSWAEDTDSVEVWEVKQDIKLLYMILSLDRRCWAQSATVEIYNEFFKGENMNDSLAPKHFPLRNKFIEKLRTQNVVGWLTSIEDKVDLEICMFKDSLLSKSIEHVTTIKHGRGGFQNYRNPLRDMQIEPHQDFFKRTATRLEGHSIQEYRKWMTASVEFEVKEGRGTKEKNENVYYNLRMKLEI